MVALLYITRHGKSVANGERRLIYKRFDGALTPLGREQAARTGAWLIDKGITHSVESV
jgi:broad specificity phosphatase PhoE